MGLSSIVKGFSVTTKSAAIIARMSATSRACRGAIRPAARGRWLVRATCLSKSTISQIVENHAETAHDKCAKNKHCQQGDRRAAVIS